MLNRTVAYEDSNYDHVVLLDLLGWAASRPLCTVNEAAQVVDLTRRSLHERRSRLSKRGTSIEGERGKYTVTRIPWSFTAATYVADYGFTPFDAIHLIVANGDPIVSIDSAYDGFARACR